MPRRRKTTSEFIKDSKKIHGDKYDYSLVDYVNNYTRVKIICPKHGEFSQVPSSHLTGYGCKKCGINQTASKNSFNTEKFIEKARELHGDKYDYSLVQYEHNKYKVKIICQEHGVFEQIANDHLQSKGCRKCFLNKSRGTTEQFIEKAKKVHGDKYDYSLAEYVHNKSKVKIICTEHGEFEQIPNNHLQGRGCIKCSRKINNKEQFIEKAKQVHGDKYDYSLVEYISGRTKAKIVCPEHGVFEQRASSHLQGTGCKKCAFHQSRISQYSTTEQFTKRARKVHGDKYDYSLVDYVNRISKVRIICPEHGEFEQTPNNHLQSRGCKNCSYLHKIGWSFSDWYDGANKSKRFDSFKVYFIKCYDEDEAFYKIGTTYTKISTRFHSTSLPYQYEIINVKEIKDINDREGARMIYDMENRFKRLNSSNKYFPKKEFRGMTECFSSPDGPLDGPALS